jgi:hypothetical protein
MNFQQIIKEIDRVSADSATPLRFNKSIEAIVSILSTILATKGVPGWHRQADPSLDLTEEDEQALQPIVDLMGHGKKVGGSAPAPAPAPAPVPAEEGTIYTIDDAVLRVKKMFEAADQKMRGFSKMLGVGDFQKSDAAEDIKLLAPPVDLISSIFPITKPIALIVREIPFPVRAIALFLYTGVEFIRIAWSLPGYDAPALRQLMSLVMAGLDALIGDWKSALLSIAGMYSQNVMYAGIAMKMGLQIFRLIDPQYQESMVFGSLSVGKSLFIGFFLRFFQIFATIGMRKKATEILDKLLEKEKKVEESIQGADGTPRPSYYTDLTFDTLLNVQAVIHEQARNCSDRFQGILAGADILSSPALVVVFSLLDIPITPEQFQQVCKKKGSWAQKLAVEQKVASNAPAEASKPEEPKAEEPKAAPEESKAEEPKAEEESKAEEPKAEEESKAKEPKAAPEESKAEEPKAAPEESKAEESKPEESKAEESKAEEPKAEEPKAEEPKPEEPKPEEPKAAPEEPKPEEPKAEEPKAEELKPKESKAVVETPKPAAPPPLTKPDTTSTKTGTQKLTKGGLRRTRRKRLTS